MNLVSLIFNDIVGEAKVLTKTGDLHLNKNIEPHKMS